MFCLKGREVWSSLEDLFEGHNLEEIFQLQQASSLQGDFFQGGFPLEFRITLGLTQNACQGSSKYCKN